MPKEFWTVKVWRLRSRKREWNPIELQREERRRKKRGLEKKDEERIKKDRETPNHAFHIRINGKCFFRDPEVLTNRATDVTTAHAPPTFECFSLGFDFRNANAKGKYWKQEVEMAARFICRRSNKSRMLLFCLFLKAMGDAKQSTSPGRASIL